MRVTVDIPDELHRRAKAEAVRRGCTLRELIEDGLRRVLDSPAPPAVKPSLAERMKDAKGIVNSGIPDLATNPKYMADFGRDSLGRGPSQRTEPRKR